MTNIINRVPTLVWDNDADDYESGVIALRKISKTDFVVKNKSSKSHTKTTMKTIGFFLLRN